jgi:hypothetical protein
MSTTYSRHTPLPHVTPPPSLDRTRRPFDNHHSPIRPTRRQSPHLLVRLVPLYAPKAPSAPYISHTRRSFSPLPAIARSKLRVQYLFPFISAYRCYSVIFLSFCLSVLAFIATAPTRKHFPWPARCAPHFARETIIRIRLPPTRRCSAATRACAYLSRL